MFRKILLKSFVNLYQKRSITLMQEMIFDKNNSIVKLMLKMNIRPFQRLKIMQEITIKKTCSVLVKVSDWLLRGGLGFLINFLRNLFVETNGKKIKTDIFQCIFYVQRSK